MTIQTNHRHPRKIFLAAVGLTPQVVTESLYVLAGAADPFIPDEIHVLTTEEGHRRVELMLIPALRELAADLGASSMSGALTAERIHVIGRPAGRPLADINTRDDNVVAADFICALVRDLTSDPVAELHVSLAGGRKTMGFLLGYALSLYGRPQDVLSHVLVNDPFQSHPDFFFPPKQPKVLLTRDNRPVRTDEADVMLAEIPFVRLRHGMPEELLAGDISYGETVNRLQRALNAPQLIFDISQQRLTCQEQIVSLPPLLLAFYSCFIRRRITGNPAGWRDISADEVIEHYSSLHGHDPVKLERVRNGLGNGMTKEYFEQKKSALHTALRSALGTAATPYFLRPVGRRPMTRFELVLDPTAITLTGKEG